MTFSERAVEAAARQIAFWQGQKIAGAAQSVASRELGWKPDGGHLEEYADKHWRIYEDHAKAALTAALAVDGLALQGWRTIDSAPKDGTEVLLWFPFTPDKPHWSHPTGLVFLAKWWISDGIDEDRWVDPDDCEDLGSTPTHWQPLPSPPLTAASDGEVG